MQKDKAGLADLKRLRKIAAARKPATAPGAPAGRGAAAARGAPLAREAAGPTAVVVNPGDAALFRGAVKTVRPIKDTRRAVLPPVPVAPAPILRQRRDVAMGKDPVRLPRTSDQYLPARHHADDSSFIKHGCGPDLITGLKRGKWPIGASLDLHGATLDEARTRLDQFLESCISHQIRCVRIVHGKGYGSKDGEPVLKDNVRRWLTQLAPVLAYSECSAPDGGAGAVQVLLKVE